MTEKPYTDADVDDLHETFAKAWTLHLGQHPAEVCPSEMNTEDCCDWHGLRAALEALTAAGRLAPADDDPRHIIDFRPDGWTIKHPLLCRLGDLFDCPVNRAVEQQVTAEPATGLGRYVCWLHEDDGLLVLGDRVDGPACCTSEAASDGTNVDTNRQAEG